MIKIKLPINYKDLKKLKAGDEVLLSGKVYTARDAAHQRLLKKLPFPIKERFIYHTGPTPARPGEVIGSCGPTTSSRMDAFTPVLLARGLAGIIGKGRLNREAVAAMKKHQALYFIAPGGCGALLASRVRKAKVVAYKDLGCEAVQELDIEDFPVICAIDARGKSIYK